MGWRRAPLATAYAALRQGKEAWHLAPGSGGVPDWLWAPAVSFFHGACLVCCFASSSRAGHKLQGLRLRSKALLPDCRLDNRELDLQPRRMLGSAGAVLDKGVRQGACHRPDLPVPNASTSSRGNGWCR